MIINCEFMISFNRIIAKNTKKYIIINPKIIRIFFLSDKYSYFFSIFFYVILKKKIDKKNLNYLYFIIQFLQFYAICIKSSFLMQINKIQAKSKLQQAKYIVKECQAFFRITKDFRIHFR